MLGFAATIFFCMFLSFFLSKCIVLCSKDWICCCTECVDVFVVVVVVVITVIIDVVSVAVDLLKTSYRTFFCYTDFFVVQFFFGFVSLFSRKDSFLSRFCGANFSFAISFLVFFPRRFAVWSYIYILNEMVRRKCALRAHKNGKIISKSLKVVFKFLTVICCRFMKCFFRSFVRSFCEFRLKKVAIVYIVYFTHHHH